jgi:hypothetical protein
MNLGAWRNTGGDWSDGLGDGKLRNMGHYVYVEPGAMIPAQIFIALCICLVSALAYIL